MRLGALPFFFTLLQLLPSFFFRLFLYSWPIEAPVEGERDVRVPPTFGGGRGAHENK